MSWRSPRTAQIKDPVLRQIIQSLENYLRLPTFTNGIRLGNGEQTGGDAATGTVTELLTSQVDSDTIIRSEVFESIPSDVSEGSISIGVDGPAGELLFIPPADSVDQTRAVAGMDEGSLRVVANEDVLNTDAGRLVLNAFDHAVIPGAALLTGLKVTIQSQSGASVAAEGPDVNISADNTYINGVAVNDPPRLSGDRSSAAVTIGSGATPTSLICNTTYNVDDAASVSFNAGTGAFTPTIPGRYEMRSTANWANAATYHAGLAFEINGTDVVPCQGPQGTGLGSTQQAIWQAQFNGSTDTVIPRAFQTSGSNKNCLLTHFTIRRIHD